MPESHLKFHSANGKRRILVIEDEFINREILGYMLRDSYDLIFAETGTKALELLEEQQDFHNTSEFYQLDPPPHID